MKEGSFRTVYEIVFTKKTLILKTINTTSHHHDRKKNNTESSLASRPNAKFDLDVNSECVMNIESSANRNDKTKNSKKKP